VTRHLRPQLAMYHYHARVCAWVGVCVCACVYVYVCACACVLLGKNVTDLATMENMVRGILGKYGGRGVWDIREIWGRGYGVGY
jgi:hypothetical protein